MENETSERSPLAFPNVIDTPDHADGTSPVGDDTPDHADGTSPDEIAVSERSPVTYSVGEEDPERSDLSFPVLASF
jgi:hypothetical protein